MVSLNEKRSKVQYVVQNKTEWVDDDNKFGKRMLEKMGWKSGVGLGKNENGRTEHIDLKFKSNLKGVGFINGKYDSTWIAHSQSFDSLLQQLQQAHSPSASSSSSTIHNFHQTVQQTKTSYKKQSSGKDLSSRSNDELDCIFGWNKGNQLKIDQIKQDSSLDMTNEIISDNLYKTSEQSIEDYFKEKTKKKAQIQYEQSQSLNDQTIDSVDQNSSNEEINERVESKLEKNLKKRRNYSTVESIVDCDQSEMLPKKKKKSDQLNNDIEDPYKNCNLSELNGYQGESRINSFIKSKLMSAEDIAEKLPEKLTLGASGFTPAGYPKVIPRAYAQRIQNSKYPENFSINLYTGASTGDELDGVLARTGRLKLKIPYQSHPDLRKFINQGKLDFIDMHLSHVSRYIREGIFPPINVAIVEACDVTSDGRIYLTNSSGMSSTYLALAKDIYVELNEAHPLEMKGLHDIYLPELHTGRPINIDYVDDRIGTPYIRVNPERIKGIILTNKFDSSPGFKKPDDASFKIANHILDFILDEVEHGRIPKKLLPFQSGVGNVANAVLACIAKDNRFKSIEMYTEVIQDSIFDLIDSDKLRFASTTALTFSLEGQKRFFNQLTELKSKFILRPMEISNNPEVIRRMGLITMNTALEADIYGNVNSTHVLGSAMMNGIGGSGDFTRNAYVSIFMTPSIAKGGKISSFVPMVSHCDHNEHSVQIMVSEQGLADLRAKTPKQRAELIIEKCVHPMYKDQLRDYYKQAQRVSFGLHTPHDLQQALSWHVRLQQTGSMHPDCQQTKTKDTEQTAKQVDQTASTKK
ncbi:unnamed protein product [Rotaria magnacalcarata]|uniref:Acetyl-CoA hydrolase n=1 Tax=Rotaria magnacalcarata TaxID=392030 RepID=A0A819DTS3_9BILA|nr:unnamed protein product [Rotaria magnacalcarata]CAF3781817.1 unnamed protein product [Rotaria magnacalcarata]CAF3786164.1 unnamed protein product [Rotaria magnacalcarata]CAF3834566.1 unnamed protein product [Rotaria magnacalcarata]